MECSEGEDSTRALAVLLAQRSDIVKAERRQLARVGVLFRKANREVSTCNRGNKWRGAEREVKCVTSPWL